MIVFSLWLIVMNVFVTKADGSRQLFDREKVAKTCIRMGASKENANEIARKIELKVYDGIGSGKILQMIFRFLEKHRPMIRKVIDLRKSLSLMKPKPDFERYIQILLQDRGYSISSNQIVKGRCAGHEVDAIARRNGETYIIEVKHHLNFHARTGLDESRIAWAILEDVIEAFEQYMSDLKIDKAMIVTNTKFSDEAKFYGECKGIQQIGWRSSSDGGLQSWIEEKRLYPITYLKDLKVVDRERLSTSGIILLSQLVDVGIADLVRMTRIPREIIATAVENAKIILSTQ
ncbi:MAG: hypothetical protein QG670_2300 [Thermoproteota archaeon]|nr:hypothetical protein [Thermoproteota archaeon]